MGENPFKTELLVLQKHLECLVEGLCRVDHPLRKLKNVTLSAHLAGTDIGTFSGSIKIVADNLEQYFSGGELKNVVNH